MACVVLEVNTRMKSGGKRGHQILGVMPEKRARAFLLDYVNLHSETEKRDAEFRRLNTLYADVVPDVPYTREREAALA